MANIVVFPDPSAEAITFLKPFFPTAKVAIGTPITWAWESLLITVSDTGGGEWEGIFQEAVITVMVSDPDSISASDVARKVYGLLDVWRQHNKQVVLTEARTKPVYYPNPDNGVPTYQLTFALVLQGKEITL